MNPEEWPESSYDGELSFASFLIAEDMQEVIGQLGVGEFSQPLFFPDAHKGDTGLGL